MDIVTQHNALKLFRQVFAHSTSISPRIATNPQKPPFQDDQPLLQPFPRTSPEAQGISSAHIAAFLTALQNDITLDMHSVLILRHGAVIAETGFGAYNPKIWHITHSQSKTITGLAIGMLIDEGKLHLEDKIIKIFEKRVPPLALLSHKTMTVRHLLTMSSGAVFNEAGAITEIDWVKSFLETGVLLGIGKLFNYNSMNTYMLSAIVHEVSGQSMMDYLQDRLWAPLGITNLFWETCPKGIEKGGWGLYIRPEDMAKIGQLILQEGRWGNRQIVSADWIREATTAHMTPLDVIGDFNYGYQIWVGRKYRSFLFNGLFGQNVIGFPDSGIMIVCNAGNDELFQQSNFFALVEKFFGGDFNGKSLLAKNRKASKQLMAVQTDLKRASISTLKPASWCASLDGKTFIAEATQAGAVGLLPLITQLLQNNFTRGLQSLKFECRNGEFFLNVIELDESYRLPIGFAAPKLAELTFHGEPYRVAVTGRLSTNEDDVPVLKIRVSFLEISNTRIIKIFFHDDFIVTQWLELPGRQCVVNAINVLKDGVRLFPFLESIITKVDNEYLRFKMNHILEPEVIARLPSLVVKP